MRLRTKRKNTITDKLRLVLRLTANNASSYCRIISDRHEGTFRCNSNSYRQMSVQAAVVLNGLNVSIMEAVINMSSKDLLRMDELRS